MEEDKIIETSRSTGTGIPPGGGERKEWARDEAERLKEELQSKGESLFNDQKASLASVLDGIANALDKSAPNFEEEGQPNTARYTRQAAESMHGLSRDLRERDLDSIKRQIGEIGRTQPVLLVGGAVALGFIASRFLRSSPEHPEESYLGERQTEREEELIIGTQGGFRAGESSTASPILTEREARESEKDFPT